MPKTPAEAPAFGVSPAEVARLRQVFKVGLDELVPLAIKAAKGEVHWTNTQVALFKVFASKVVPDMSANLHIHQHSFKRPEQMSIEELMRIAAGASGPTIDAEPEPH